MSNLSHRNRYPKHGDVVTSLTEKQCSTDFEQLNLLSKRYLILNPKPQNDKNQSCSDVGGRGQEPWELWAVTQYDATAKGF